jgi:glycosyltransferase involved in cell wall biosynthesis
MRTIWLFRTNLPTLEYYHSYTDLKTFEDKCHDYYLLFMIWLLKNNHFDTAVVWRLSKKPRPDITFHIDGHMFIQRWVTDFRQCFDYNKPDVSFFRGGFPEYDQIVKERPGFLGLKLYLGAGKRQYPMYGGTYDAILYEDQRDKSSRYLMFAFYKAANPKIFFPKVDPKKEYEGCLPANFSQLKYKGQELLLQTISNSISQSLKKMKFIIPGNDSNTGTTLCSKHGVTNVDIPGQLTRSELNDTFNASLFGMVLSNQKDGSPRTMTEILFSGTPLLVLDETRLLNFYKDAGVGVTTRKNLEMAICSMVSDPEFLRNRLLKRLETDLTFDNICQMNIDLWNKMR